MDRLTREIEQVHARCGFCKGNQSVCYNSSARSAGERDCLLGLMRDLALQSLPQEAVRDEALEAERVLKLISELEVTEQGVYTNAGKVMRQMARNYFALKREPNAAAKIGQSYEVMGIEQATAPAAPDVAEMVPTREVYCHECSKAGGADKPIYHKPPVCTPGASDE